MSRREETNIQQSPQNRPFLDHIFIDFRSRNEELLDPILVQFHERSKNGPFLDPFYVDFRSRNQSFLDPILVRFQEFKNGDLQI